MAGCSRAGSASHGPWHARAVEIGVAEWIQKRAAGRLGVDVDTTTEPQSQRPVLASLVEGAPEALSEVNLYLLRHSLSHPRFNL